MGCDAYLCIGDVYRRDEIDASHYPVFHQIDSARLFTKEQVLFLFYAISKRFNKMKIINYINRIFILY